MKYIVPLLFTGITLIAASCANSQSENQPKSANGNQEKTTISERHELSPQQFGEKMNHLLDAPVLDVRTPREFAEGNLNRAINLDWNNPEFKQAIQSYDPSKPIFVYCLSGGRSGEAAAYMRYHGFAEVYELAGGILKWKAAGFSLLNEKNASAGMTRADYDRLLKNNQPVLVDFYAPWCGPCRKMEPYLQEIAEEMKGKASVVRIDIDKNRALAQEMGVVQLPVLILYKDGKEVWSKRELADKNELLQAIETAMH